MHPPERKMTAVLTKLSSAGSDLSHETQMKITSLRNLDLALGLLDLFPG